MIPETIIGIDLGHGETSVSIVTGGNQNPRIVEINNKKSIITAYGKSKSLGTVIGEKVFNLPDVESLNFRFKKAPSAKGFSPKILKDYFKALLEKIKQNKILTTDEEQVMFFIGCPSGWSNSDVLSYQKVFQEVFNGKIKVVRESRAALLQAKEINLISNDDLKDSVMVLDIGSLTTDVSHIYSGTEDEKIDAGVSLGSGLLDELIFEASINYSNQKDEIVSYFSKDLSKANKAKCLFVCRLAKESFFNEEDEFRNFRNDVDVRNVKMGLTKSLLFEPKVNAEVIDKILEKKIPKLGNQSWKKCFFQLLINSRNKLVERNFKPQILLLTGGASRMPFIKELCKEVFPQSKIIRYFPPEETVCKGLARWGNIYVHTNEFSEKIIKLCRKQLPKEINRYRKMFSENISKEISEVVCDEIVKRALEKWRSGEIDTVNDIEDYLQDKIQEWLNSKKGKKLIVSSCTDLLSPLVTFINSETMSLCQDHGIPHKLLKLDTDYDIDKVADKIDVFTPLEGVIATTDFISFLTILIGGMILKYYVGIGMVTPFGNIVMIAVFSSFALIVGTQVMEQKMKEAKFPLWSRKFTLSEKKILELITRSKIKISNELSDSIENEKYDELKNRIIDTFEKGLLNKANEVKWIIE